MHSVVSREGQHLSAAMSKIDTL